MSWWHRELKLERRARAWRSRAPRPRRPVYVWLQTSGRAARQRQEVLLALARSGTSGMTRNELARSLRMPVSSVCGRLDELLKERLVLRGPARPSTVTGIANETFHARRALVGRVIPIDTGEPRARRQTLLESWT